MAEGFKIADAYVDVETRYDQDQVTTAAREAGDDAGATFSKSSGERLRDSRGRFVRDVEDVFGDSGDKGGRHGGRRGAMSMLRSMGDAFKATAGVLFTPKVTSAVGEGLMGAVKSPVGLAAIAAVAASAGTMLAAGISATLAVALGAGLGLGFIGLGALLLKDEPKIQAGFKRIGKTFNSVFGGAAKRNFLGPFVKSLDIVNGLLKSLAPSIDMIFKALAPAIVPLTTGFAGMIQAMMPGLILLMQQVGPFLITLAGKLPALGKNIGDFLGKIAQNWPAIQQSFFTFMSDLGRVLGVLATAFIWLATHYEQARNVFVSIMAVSNLAIVAVVGLYKAYQYLATNIPIWLHNAGAAISGFFSAIGTTVSGWYHSTIAWFQGIGSAIASFVSSAVSYLAALPGRVGTWLAQLPGVVLHWIKETADKGLFAIGFMIGSWLKFWIDLPGRIRSAISTTWAFMVGTWNTVKTNVTNWTRQAVDNAVRFFQALPGRARSAVASLWSSLSGAFSSARTNATNQASALVSGTVNWLRGLPGKARAAIAGVPGQIKSVFSGAGSWLYSAGKNILLGLTNGMKGAVGAAINAAKHAAEQVIGGLKSALGIASPSKVAAEEVGRWIPPGITEGIARQMPKERQKINGMTPAVVGPAVQGQVTSSVVSSAPSRAGVTIGQLVVHLQGVFDMTNPVELRRLAAKLHAMLAQYEREYA